MKVQMVQLGISLNYLVLVSLKRIFLIEFSTTGILRKYYY